MLDNGFNSTILPPWNTDQHRAYDFWRGLCSNNWRQRADGEFFHTDQGIPFTHVVLPVLDGKALVELASSDAVVDDGPFGGHRVWGCSIRYLDEKARQWVMAESWPYPHDPTGFWEQLRGEIRHRRIELLSTRLDDDRRPFTLRYTFSDIGPNSFRWDQARSWDRGTSWKIGSMAEFTAVDRSVDWPELDAVCPTYASGSTCECPEARRFDVLEGEWHGTYTKDADHGPLMARARLDARRVLDGAGILSVLQVEDDDSVLKVLEAKGYNLARGEWWSYRLDNRPTTGHRYEIGAVVGDEIVLSDAPDVVLRDGLEPMDLIRDRRADSNSTRQTRWEELGPERLRYSVWGCVRPDGEWKRVARVELKRRR